MGKQLWIDTLPHKGDTEWTFWVTTLTNKDIFRHRVRLTGPTKTSANPVVSLLQHLIIPWASPQKKALPREGWWPWWGAPPPPRNESCSLPLRTFHGQCFQDSDTLGGPGGLWGCVGRGDILTGCRTQALGGVHWVQEPRASQPGGPDTGVEAEPAS